MLKKPLDFPKQKLRKLCFPVDVCKKYVKMTGFQDFREIPQNLLRETQLLENVMTDFVKHANIFLRFYD